MTELTTEPIRPFKHQNIVAHMRLKAHHPHGGSAAHYEPPHQRENKAIDVPLVSARVYPLSAPRRNSAQNSNRNRSVSKTLLNIDMDDD